eukprot:gene11937-15978_t
MMSLDDFLRKQKQKESDNEDDDVDDDDGNMGDEQFSTSNNEDEILKINSSFQQSHSLMNDGENDLPNNDDKLFDSQDVNDANDNDNLVDLFTSEKKIPISNQIDLYGHTKAVTCISFEPAGNRVVTGSLDYDIKIFDFGGMDGRHRPFKSIEAQENHMVSSVSHSPSGDKFIVGTGSAQPKIYDREGNEIIKFAKGDMYLRDLSNTKGHTMEVTGVQWHPVEKNIVMTSGLDGAVRVWDLLGEALFGNLINKHVLKIRGLTGQSRVGASSCCYSTNGEKMIGGATDGSIHIWNQKKVYSRADVIIRLDISGGSNVICVTVSPDNSKLAARFENGNIALWNLTQTKEPLKVINSMHNDYPTANVEFSIDSTLLCCGTSPERKLKSNIETSKGPVQDNNQEAEVENSNEKSRLLFFDVAGDSISPRMQISVATGASVIMVKWQKTTNQIFCSLSSGIVRVLYDPLMSKKGALLTVNKAPKREKDPSDFAIVGEIINPLALPMFRNDPKHSHKKRSLDLKDPAVAHIPKKPATQGPGTRPNTNFFFTNYVMSGRSVDNSRNQDPREALLKRDAEAKANPLFVGKAYQKTQPNNILYGKTFEQEQEEFKKDQKKFK